MSLPRIQYPGAFYHVYSRGVDKRTIFMNSYDYEKFTHLIDRSWKKHPFFCYAYCLMPNHYHFFIQTPEKNLSSIMQWVNARYAGYFNNRLDRVGALFQGRFQSELVAKESYSLELSRYIHLNPVRSGLVTKPEDWKWSSYGAYLGKSPKPSFLDTQWLLAQFQNDLKGFQSFTEAGIGSANCSEPRIEKPRALSIKNKQKLAG